MRCLCLLTLAIMFNNSKANGTIDQCPANCTCLIIQRHVLCVNASLTSIPPRVQNNTVEIHLQHNYFPVLRDSFEWELPEIRGFYLSYCGINTIATEAFHKVTNIQYLHLDSNQLGDLQEGTFSNLNNLIYLHLENNRISYLHQGLFSPLKKLTGLYLSNNLLQELSDGSLDGLTQLRWLDLGFNNLYNISGKSLKNITSLRVLNLERNNLTSIPNAIKRKNSLKTLRLSGNHIVKLSTVSFGRNMRSLSELYLDNMGLEKLSSLTFVRLKMLKVVDLRNNTLQSLSITRIPVFTKVYLAGNPWRCDCSLIRLQIQLLLIKSLDTEQQVLCQSPNALKGESLVKIHLLKLTCPAFGEDVSGTSPLTPSIRRLPHTSILSVAETLKTTMNYQSLPKTTFLTTTRNTIEANVQDPCLADQISNVLVSSAEKKSLDVSWSAHGDFNQFEIRYSTAEDMSTLRITVSLTKVRLYHLQPGTYRICIVPWSVEIFKCPAPKSRQCAEGQTEDTAPEHAHHVDFPPGSNSPLITAGVSVGLIVLIAVIIFIVYKIRSNKIQFQRYYNEDRAERSRKQETDPYTWDGVYENIDEDRHVYVTASSLWGMDNEKLDCSVTEQGSLPSVPKYVTL